MLFRTPVTDACSPTLLSYDLQEDNHTGDQLTSNVVLDAIKPVTAAETKKRLKITWRNALLHSHDPRISCIKLFLASGQKLPSFVDVNTIKKQLSKARRTPVAAAADYLSEVMAFVWGELNTRYSEEFVRSTRKEFIMTVPAIWSDAAKDATKKAAQLAGITGNLKMISEVSAVLAGSC